MIETMHMSIDLEIIKVLVLSNSHVKKESLYKGTIHLTACGDWGGILLCRRRGRCYSVRRPRGLPTRLISLPIFS